MMNVFTAVLFFQVVPMKKKKLYWCNLEYESFYVNILNYCYTDNPSFKSWEEFTNALTIITQVYIYIKAIFSYLFNGPCHN